MRQLSTRDQMTQKLATTCIGHLIAFNNEQSPYLIVSYKRPQTYNGKTFKQENLQPNLCTK